MRFAASVTVVSRVAQTTLRWQNSLIAIFFPSRIHGQHMGEARNRRDCPSAYTSASSIQGKCLSHTNETAVAKNRFPFRPPRGPRMTLMIAPRLGASANPLRQSADEEWRPREFPPQTINRLPQGRSASMYLFPFNNCNKLGPAQRR